MKIFGLTTNGLELAGRSLDFVSASAARAAANIANSATPGYKAQQVSFEGAMAEALKTPATGGMAKTHPGHLPVTDIQRVMPAMTEGDSSARLDGNTVDLDQEVTRVAEMNLSYSAYTTIANKQLGLLKSAISLSAQ
ncbi:MAG: flagellar basal body rod protein FlgB [Nitrospinae bacterium]|nr:flagellar basal body rod protein FlgB [Nitrospinota bacterium]